MISSQKITGTDIETAIKRVHDWLGLALVKVDVLSNPDNLRVADNHDGRCIVRREQFHQEIHCSGWKLNLELEVDLCADVHDGRVVVLTSLQQSEGHISDW